jgi:hypothetical protein
VGGGVDFFSNRLYINQNGKVGECGRGYHLSLGDTPHVAAGILTNFKDKI